MEFVCSVYVDCNEFGVREVVVRCPDNNEYRDPILDEQSLTAYDIVRSLIETGFI